MHYQNSEPAPTLEGTWDAQTQTAYNYRLDGTAGPQEGPTSQIGQFRAEIGATFICYVYTTSTGIHQGNAFVDTRQGELLVNRVNGKKLEIRDKFLLCTYTPLRIGDADTLRPAQLHNDMARVKTAKTGVTCIILLVDDHVFKSASLLRAYASQAPQRCLPRFTFPYLYLPHVQHLAGISRLPVLFHTGRKTFATLKVAQGVPRAQVMMTTGHQTEASLNHYLGIDEAELLDWYRRTARHTA